MPVDTHQVDVLCETVRTALGPFGANKLVVQADGSVTNTSSGGALMESLVVDDALVSVFKDSAASFDAANGDGISTLVALTGAMLGEANRLIEEGLHPTEIERGYRLAIDVAQDHLEAHALPIEDVGVEAVATTALTATRDPETRRRVSDYLARIVDQVDSTDGSFDPDRQVKVVSRLGGALSQTDLVTGVVLDEQPVLPSMPRSVEGVGVALLSETIDVPKFAGTFTRRESMTLSATVEGFEERAAMQAYERDEFARQVRNIVDAGCGFLVTARSVNDRVETVLANHGILALDNVDEYDLRMLARATGATVMANVDHVAAEHLGTADVEVRRFAGRDMTVVESDGTADVWTLFCRAPDAQSVETFERSVESALSATFDATRTAQVVPGGGAIEASTAAALRDRARSVGGREQMAMAAFGDALTVVPRTLAENAGLDGATALTRLRAAHDAGRDTVGIDALLGDTADVLPDDPIVDPLGLKGEIWEAAADLTIKLVRIDEELPATDLDPDDE